MFGRRPEGRTVKGLDAITKLTPYIMTTRNDAMCFITKYLDYDPINRYIRKKRAEGVRISVMEMLLAAYVRTVAKYPELNRFVVGRKLFARRELCVSFAIIKVRSATEFLETTVKIFFDPTDTISEVARKVEETIAQNKTLEDENSTDKVANVLVSIPGLLAFGVGLLKALDRIGLMPRAIINASPFHTSMFITNVGSLGMGEMYHHLYNFGTTTVFLGLGKREYKLVMGADGTVSKKSYYPMGAVIDERVSAGAMYGLAFDYFDHLLHHPEELETPPETVRYDYKNEYHTKSKKKVKAAQ